jgi:signal peptidase I
MSDPNTTPAAAQPADAKPADSSAKTPAKNPDGIGEIIKTLVYAVLIAVGFRSFAYEPFNIPSESMLPNLLVGDYLFVSKFSYGYSRYSFPFGFPPFSGRVLEGAPERGDVVVFKWPKDDRTDYIKRVIGLPGDQIQMRGGVLYINGQMVPKKRVADAVIPVSENSDCLEFPMFRQVEANGEAVCRFPQFEETLPNGRVVKTLDLIQDDPYNPRDNTRVFIVPEGHYFMMGDNRDDSTDSRVSLNEPQPGVGFVPAENLVGRAEMLFFSTDGSARLWTPWNWLSAARFERFFNGL